MECFYLRWELKAWRLPLLEFFRLLGKDARAMGRYRMFLWCIGSFFWLSVSDTRSMGRFLDVFRGWRESLDLTSLW